MQVIININQIKYEVILLIESSLYKTVKRSLLFPQTFLLLRAIERAGGRTSR